MELLLIPDEMARFAAWLEHEAIVARGLADKIGSLTGTFSALAGQERKYADAAILIARRIRNTESTSIG